MKILIVAPYYIPYISGMTILVQRLAEGFVRSGHSVCVLTSRHENGLPPEELMNGVRVVRKRVLFRMQRGAFAPGITSALAGLAKDYDIVNIHAPFFEAGLLGLVARLSGRKYVLSYICDLRMQGSPISLGKAIESLYYLSVKSAARHSEKIIVLSKGYIESSRLKEYAPKSVAVIPPIDTEKFVRVADVSSFKKRYGIGVDDVVVGFLGRLTHEKGVEYLLQAAPRIIEKVPKAKIVVAGEGENVAGGLKESMKAKLQEHAKQLGLGDRVVFTGFLDDRMVLEFYSRCQVFVLPSIDPLEAFGMVQVEAMLCTRAGPIPEQIGTGAFDDAHAALRRGDPRCQPTFPCREVSHGDS